MSGVKNLKVTFFLKTSVILDRYTTIDSILLYHFYKNKNHKKIINPLFDRETDFIKKENNTLSGSIWFISENTPIAIENVLIRKTPERNIAFNWQNKFKKKIKKSFICKFLCFISWKWFWTIQKL